MKLLGWFVAGFLVGLVATSYAESKHEKDLRECNAAAAEAVAEARVRHPADAEEVRRAAFNRCMRDRGYATPPIK